MGSRARQVTRDRAPALRDRGSRSLANPVPRGAASPTPISKAGMRSSPMPGVIAVMQGATQVLVV